MKKSFFSNSGIPLLALVGGVLAVSTSSLLTRYAQAYAPSLVIACYRLSFATLILSPFAIGRNKEELWRLTPKQVLLLAVGGLFLAAHFATWISSLQFTSVASSVVLVTTAPLWVALGSPWLLHEPVSKRKGLAIFIALIGSGIVATSGFCNGDGEKFTCGLDAPWSHGQVLLGNILALVGALMAAGYLFIGRKLRSNVSLISYTFTVYGFAAVLLFVFVLLANIPVSGYSSNLTLLCILLAVVPQLLGHSSFNWALKYLSAALVSIALLGEPIGSTILAAVLLKEPPSPLEVIGGVFILAGIILASKENNT